MLQLIGNTNFQECFPFYLMSFYGLNFMVTFKDNTLSTPKVCLAVDDTETREKNEMINVLPIQDLINSKDCNSCILRTNQKSNLAGKVLRLSVLSLSLSLSLSLGLLLLL